MISELQRVSKSRKNRHGSTGQRLRRAREEAGYDTIVAGARALRKMGVEVSHQQLGHYERDRTAPQTDVFLDICDVFDASPLYVLLGLGPRHWTELVGDPGPGTVSEPSASYGIANGDTAAEVRVPVRPDERRAFALIAQVRETSVQQIMRERLDLPGVLAEEERIRGAIDRYESATRDKRVGE